MKQLHNILICFIFILLLACQTKPEKEKVSSTSGSVPVAEQNDSQTIINANLASLEELVTVGLSRELSETIVKKRPFLLMNDLHQFLKAQVDSLTLATLYAKMFVPFN